MTTHVEKLCQELEALNPNASDLSVRVACSIAKQLREAINKDKIIVTTIDVSKMSAEEAFKVVEEAINKARKERREANDI